MTEQSQGTSAAKAGARSSHRVQYSIRLRISGADSSGNEFSEPAHTELITRDGGLMVCGVTLATGNQVRLERGGRSAVARIVGMVGMRDYEFAYGIHFLDTSGRSFWGVEFPPVAPGSGVGRTVLECSHCACQLVFELSEVEIMLLESVHVVSRHCSKCGDETLWQVPTLLTEPELVTSETAYADTVTHEKAQRTRNDRKHARLAMKRTKACIKRLGVKNDVVDVGDVSRGGFRFFSFVDYQPKTYVEVAVPYTEGGANVFIPARVVRVHSRAVPPDQCGEYACQYEKRG